MPELSGHTTSSVLNGGVDDNASREYYEGASKVVVDRDAQEVLDSSLVTKSRANIPSGLASDVEDLAQV